MQRVLAMTHLRALDGLRGLAVLMVILFHALMSARWLGPVARTGWIGVDLFFVLSGFLITRILLQQKDSPNLRNFYWRRALRIWPLYLLLLIFTVAVAPRLPAVPPIPPIQDWFWYWATLIQNFVPAALEPWPLTVTWSLAVEEQFYLLWPVLVIALSARTFRLLVAAIIVGSPVLRVIALVAGVTPHAIHSYTPFRLDGLAFGALVALLGSAPSSWRTAILRIGPPALCVGIGCAFWIGSNHPEHAIEGLRIAIFGGVHTFISIGFASSVLRVLRAVEEKRPAGWLEWRWLAALGTVSYCAYLIHQPIFVVSQSLLRPGLYRVLPMSHSAATFVAIGLEIMATIVLSALSWIYLEKPILRLKSRFSS